MHKDAKRPNTTLSPIKPVMRFEENLLNLNENVEVPRAASGAAAPGCSKQKSRAIAAAATF